MCWRTARERPRFRKSLIIKRLRIKGVDAQAADYKGLFETAHCARVTKCARRQPAQSFVARNFLLERRVSDFWVELFVAFWVSFPIICVIVKEFRK